MKQQQHQQHSEKVRVLSQKNKRQAQYSLFLLAKTQKKSMDDPRFSVFKKGPDGFTVVEFPTDYTANEVKVYKAHQLNIAPNGNPLKIDSSYNHQAYINSTTYKLDKEMFISNSNNINNMVQYREVDPQLEGPNVKLLTNFLQIKSVTLSNQYPTAKRLNQPIKIILPGLTSPEKERKNSKRDDINTTTSTAITTTNTDINKKKILIKSFSGMRSHTPFQTDHKQSNLQNITEIDDNHNNNELNDQNRGGGGSGLQTQNKQREQRSKTINDRRKEFQEPINLNLNNINSNTNAIGFASSGPTSPTSIEKISFNTGKNNGNPPPQQKIGPMQFIKEISNANKRSSNASQLQKIISPYPFKTSFQPNNQSMNNSAPLSQSAIIMASNTGNINQQQGAPIENNNSAIANLTNLSNSHVISSRPYRIEQPKQIAYSHDDKRKIYMAPPPNTNFKYYVGLGNNGELVKRVMSKREWWEECEEYNSLFNFKWQQYDRGYKYERLVPNQSIKQIVNHFEFQREISTKNLLIKNLATYSEQNKLILFDMTPTTFVLDMDDELNFDNDMQHFAKFFIKHHSNPSKYPKPEGVKNSHIVYNFDFKRKRNISIPPNSDKKYSIYLKPKMHETFNKGFNIWLLKPTGYNRGRGIEVFNTLEALNVYINEYFDGFVELGPNQKRSKKNDPESGGDSEGNEDDDKKKVQGAIIKSHTFVLQKYIESPLLINQRKFDFRVWTLITHEMNLYFFKEGYLRLSSAIFTLNENNIDDKFIHLTNNAVQKYAENYGQYENGNQLSFAGFEKYMGDSGMSGDFKGKILPRMKELVTISMNSVKKLINVNERKYCMEIFGYDFFIDSDFNVWLIEVNTNPCIEESSPILEQYLPRMLDDAFKMTLDVIFPRPIKRPQVGQPIQTIIQEGAQQQQAIPSQKTSASGIESSNTNRKPKEKAFSVEGYKDDENMWEFLCNLQVIKSPAKNPRKNIQI